MADTKTFGVKVPEELHQEAAELQKKLGLTGEGFLEELIRTYKSEKTKEQVPAVAEDLKELHTLTRRIDNIYLNLAYRIENINKAKEEEIQDVISKKDSIIFEAQNKYNNLNNEHEALIEAYNNIVNLNNDAKQQVTQLTNMYNDNKALVEEYKNKNDMLTGMLQKYEKYPEQIEQYKGLLADAQARHADLTNTLNQRSEEVKHLNETIESLKSANAAALEDLKVKHKEEVEKIKEHESFLKDKALLEQDKLHQSEINKTNENSNSRIKELLDTNQEFNKRISSLLEENQELKNKQSELNLKIKEHDTPINKSKTRPKNVDENK